jgi:hypothetical protein
MIFGVAEMGLALLRPTEEKANMPDKRFDIEFMGVDAAEANSMANALRDLILNAHPSVKVTPAQPDPTAQDLGSILQVIISDAPVIAPAITAVAGAITAFLRLRRTASIRIKKDGEVIISNVTPDQAAEIERQLTLAADRPGS